MSASKAALYVLCIVAAGFAAGCAQAPEQASVETVKEDIVQVLEGDPRFSTLVKAIEAAELGDVLKGVGPYTLFAPTDDAFAKLPAGKLDELLKPENREKLADVLGLHLVSQNLPSSEIAALEPDAPVQSYSAEFLTIGKQGGTIAVNGAKVEQADIKAKNGVVHAIDAVLLPPG